MVTPSTDDVSKIGAFNNLASIQLILEEYEKGIENLQKVIDLASKLDAQQALSRAYNNLGQAYRKLKEFDKAINYSTMSLSIAQNIHTKLLRQRLL